VLLLRLMLSRANFLLLDEPTNHLDIGSCEALEAALQDYEGTLLIVSHDRYLINKIADRVYYLDRDGTREYAGNYDSYLEKTKENGQREAGEKNPEKKKLYRLRKEKESELRKKRTALKRAEQEIEEVDAQIAQTQQELLEPETAADYEAAMKLTQRLASLKEQSDALFARWGRLSEELEADEA
jgi:ATP-binding cassette subfamily F protein 3